MYNVKGNLIMMSFICFGVKYKEGNLVWMGYIMGCICKINKWMNFKSYIFI